MALSIQELQGPAQTILAPNVTQIKKHPLISKILTHFITVFTKMPTGSARCTREKEVGQ